MTVDSFNGMKGGRRTEATQVVIRDGRFGNVVAIIAEPSPGRVDMIKAGDPGFEEAVPLTGAGVAPDVEHKRWPEVSSVRI